MSAPSSSESRIRIAIIGGGLAGSTLANALVQLQHVEVHVFESAPEFSERGASVVLSSNAIQALSRTIPAAKEVLEKAGAVTMNSSKFCIGSGPQAGTVIMDMTTGPRPNSEINGMALHRASFLRELLAPLPQEVLHVNKKLTSITQSPSDSDSGDTSNGSVTVTFEDGATEYFNAVVGTDGIFGFVRNYVLRDAAAEHGPTPAGFWDSRALVPTAKARAVIGEEHFDPVDAQHAWLGDGAFLLYDVLESGTMTQVVISGVESNPSPDERKQPLTRAFLEESLAAWLDGPVAQSVIELTLDQADPQRYSEWEHKSTPTYVNGRVCIAGDAAHATTPWQAAGAGQAIEDAMILGALLGNAKEVGDIKAAFRAYDVVRRPRAQRVIDSSRGTGVICCGREEGVGVDADGIRGALKDRWTFIMSLDLDKYKRDAVKKMDEFLLEQKLT